MLKWDYIDKHESTNNRKKENHCFMMDTNEIVT
jgi:hypothetical protein